MAASAQVAQHPLWHLVVVAVAPIAIIFALTRYDRIRYAAERRAGPPRHDAGVAPAIAAAALASVGAALIHAAVCPEHFHEATVFGLFFLVTSVVQLAWAGVVVRRPQRSVFVVGLAVNAAVVGIWLFTRTVSVPLGPEAGRPEAVGGADAVASILEALIVFAMAKVVRDTGATAASAPLPS